MGLGDRLLTWLRSLAAWQYVTRWFAAAQERQKTLVPKLAAQTQRAFEAGDAKGILMCIWAWVALYFAGGSLWLPGSIDTWLNSTAGVLEEFTADPQKFMQEQLNTLGTSPGARAFTEFVGTIITEPVVSLLETYAARPDADPHEMARAFHGIASGLPWAATTLDSILKTALGDRAPQVGNSIMSLYWGLGLGFLGWQTLAPLLSSGLQPNLARYYNKLYRPMRFTPGQVQDLFSLGKITGGAFDDYLREQGWRDQDIAFYRELAYRPLSEGDCWKLYHDGVIDKAEMDRRLRSFGYNTADFELIYKANPAEDEASVKGFTVSTLKAALKAKLVDETEFRAIMAQLKYQPREIDLQVALIRAQQTQEARELTTGQIKELYNTRVIGKDEAATNLRRLGYAGDVADQLVQAWDAESLPRAVRLNKSTILEAFTEGVYSRGQAVTALQAEAGYDATRAELLVKVEEAGIARRAAPARPQPATLGQLAAFVKYGLITRSELEARPELTRYDEATRALQVELLYLQLAAGPTAGVVSFSTLADAYVFGLLTREEYTTRLVARGFSDVDADLQARVVEAQNPAAFGAAEEQPVKVPSISSLQLAFQRGLIDEEGFRGRLAAQGYSDDAVEIALFNAQYQAPAAPRQLTKAEVISLYKTTDITRADAKRRLLLLGYTAVDVDLIVRQVRLAVEDTDAAAYFLLGLMEINAFVAAVLEEGFTPEEVDDFLARVAAGEFG